MSEPTQTKDRPKALFLSPPRNLASCIYGALVRDTRGCTLNDNELLNHFAASPLCAVSWCFEGSCSLLNTGAGGKLKETPINRMAFSGPQTGPMTSINNGQVYAMTVAIYPDAFARLTGINVGDFINQTHPIEDVLPKNFLDLVKSIQTSGDAASGFQILNEFISPLWHEQRASTPKVLNAISDWTMSTMEQASKSGLGRSVRQVERRIKSRTGQTQRDLEFYARIEHSFELASKAMKSGRVNAAEIAFESGFADQSHMGRNVKRQTGHSPKDLLWRIENEEAYWSYRLIGGIVLGAA